MTSLSVYTAYNGYFDKKKALSLGLTTGGSGVGVILIPIMLRMLFDNFSFSGAILLYGKNKINEANCRDIYFGKSDCLILP